MVDLLKLKVSLTKHNAHKIADLLREYPANQVLHHLDEQHVERAQAYKNLSVQKDGAVPHLWERAQAAGDDAIDAMVMLGIIYSHHRLIEGFSKAAANNRLSGTIVRDDIIEGKEYTNIARVVDQLGFAEPSGFSETNFNFSQFMKIDGLGPIFRDLLGLKLKAAGWDETSDLVDEAVALRLHQPIGLEAKGFRSWLKGSSPPGVRSVSQTPEDKRFFDGAGSDKDPGPFKFKAGHKPKSTGEQNRAQSKPFSAIQLHNQIQNDAFDQLAKAYGREKVGTENPTGSGTSIDLVLQENKKTTFFEIKTARTAKAAIRQALPQLLEYAHWPDVYRADRFVIIAPGVLSNNDKVYLRFLNRQYGIPISYLTYNVAKRSIEPSKSDEFALS